MCCFHSLLRNCQCPIRPSLPHIRLPKQRKWVFLARPLFFQSQSNPVQLTPTKPNRPDVYQNLRKPQPIQTCRSQLCLTLCQAFLSTAFRLYLLSTSNLCSCPR